MITPRKWGHFDRIFDYKTQTQVVAFALIWLYSVLDAYLTGKKLDHPREGGPE